MLTQLAKRKLDAIIDEACDAEFKLEFEPATTTELANSLIFVDEIQKRVRQTIPVNSLFFSSCVFNELAFFLLCSLSHN